MSHGHEDHLHMPLWRWCFILTMGIATIVCGTAGLVLYETQHGPPGEAPVLQSVYHAFQMLILHTPHFEHGANGLILAAEFCGAVTVFFAAAVLLRTRLRRELLRNPLMLWSGHLVVCGLGQKGFEIVKRHSRERRLPFRKRMHLSYDRLKRRLEGREVECPRRIVVIDPAPNERLMEMCEEAGVCVLVGDASMPEVLVRARVAEAAEVVVITPSDETNVRIATAIRELSLNARSHPECNVHIADIHLREALDRWIDSGDDRPKTRPHFFDVFDTEARRVLRDHPLDGAGIRTDDPTAVHVVILGFGRMARSLALRAAKVGHFANRKKLRISVIDRNADRQRERFAFRHPALADGKICDLEFFSAEAESATTGDHLKKWAAEPAVRLHVFICLDDDTRSLEMALRMQTMHRDHGDCGLYVRVRSQHSIAPILDVAAGGQSRIVPFGAVEDSCSEESYRDGKLNVIACAIHGEFVRQRSAGTERTPQSDLALRDWKDLRDDIRESNRQQADHLRVKLRAIGCELVANDVPGEPVEALTPAEIEKLAPMEHNRWNAERWLAGWNEGKADKSNRFSPYLLPWEALPPEIQRYDVDAVERIPALVREAIAGMKIIRNGSSPA